MFLISKLFWGVANPISLLLLLAACGVLALALGRRKLSVSLLACTAVTYLVLAFSPLGDWLLASLENREPPASFEDIAGASGIIVLGGTIMESTPTGSPEIYNFGGRMAGAVELGRRFPNLPIIFSGGSGALLWRPARTEAELAFAVFSNSGIDPSRIKLESRSRNTFENAVFTARLLKPKPQEKWVLVTSAFHMPRAKALFEAQGFKILPWPTDYQAKFWGACFPEVLAREALCRLSFASKEWVGGGIYWLRGDIAHL